MLKVTLNLQDLNKCFCLNKSFALALSFVTQVRGAYYTRGLGFSQKKTYTCPADYTRRFTVQKNMTTCSTRLHFVCFLF